MHETATASIETPLGPVTVESTARHLTGARIAPRPCGAPLWQRRGALSHPLLSTTLNQLEQWFGGKRQEFDLPLMPSTSEEAARLRAAIASVGFGTTLTYGALADQIGSAARAIGQACKTNPFPIIIPCHRIVSASGPEFYSGGAGPKTKTWLLDFEYAKLPDLQKHRLL